MSNLVKDLEHWGDAHHSKWLDGLRVLLGFIILSKGIAFISDTEALDAIIRRSGFDFISFMLAHYIACAHLVGGILIILGLITRIAIAFQIPVLLGAVFFVNITQGFSAINSEFWLSFLVLALLIFFFISGSGNFSVDQYMKTHKET